MELPPVIVVLRAHGSSLPHKKPIPHSIINLFSQSRGPITLLRRSSKIGEGAQQSESEWKTLFELLNNTTEPRNKEMILRTLTRDVGDTGHSQPWGIKSVAHGIDHGYWFYEIPRSTGGIAPQNSRALGIYDISAFNRYRPGQIVPSGDDCGYFLESSLDKTLPLGPSMPFVFNNLQIPEKTNEGIYKNSVTEFRRAKLSTIALDLTQRYPGRQIILLEVSCRNYVPFAKKEDDDYMQLVSAMGDLSVDNLGADLERTPGSASVKRTRSMDAGKKKHKKHKKRKRTKKHQKRSKPNKQTKRSKH